MTRTHIKPETLSSQQGSLASATQLPPTIFSEVLKRTSGSSCAPPPPSSKADDTEDLVGAFGDEDLDKTLEREVVALMLKSQGKQPVMSTISILSTSTDPDFEPPPSTQPCLKNRTLMPPPSTPPGLKNQDLMPPPSMQPQAISNTKRKKLAEVIKFSESEISEFPNTDDDLMEVDGPNDESDADIKPEPVGQNTQVRCTTASVSPSVIFFVFSLLTSVTTTTHKTPLPPSKKVKLKKNAKLEGNIKSEGTLTALPGTWVESVSKVRLSYLNTDLLPGCHEDGKWAQVFLLTVFLWLSAQEELWVIADAKLLMACKEIFKVVYLDIRYNVTTSGSVFGVVTQCVGEWRSNFRSTALVIAIDFCASNQDSMPAELAELLLVHYVFLYPNPDNIDKSATFHSLECAFSLLADNTVTIDHEDNSGLPITAWRACLKTLKTFNKAMGKETVSEHAFPIAKWKSKTDAFIHGAAKKGEASTELTVSMAWKLLKKPTSAKPKWAEPQHVLQMCHAVQFGTATAGSYNPAQHCSAV
ncbi:uncharacterized protein EDB91DRAFT_1245654 [Suillus paluster]|uniref:uncharacterized protein n=1 Tax=Suillus paluster TaxID=48578 RepID=UPI001B8839E9|nr:uncharacterized protein EDB91DRAFT_1245654 [Suillus paluster]KAG1747217.1 hypothetical protein EDB91DRAFT_1245654 [Suillus paluster]